MYQLLPVIVGLLAPSVASLSVPSAQQLLNSWSSGESSDLCPLAPKIEAPDDGFFSSVKFVTDDAVKSRQVDRLSRAVQVPTAIDDYMKDPYDEKFAPFLDFHELLQTLFPLL